MSDVAALILAAGRGTRFGASPKMLAMLDGKPLLRHVAEAALASSARPVLVVTGHRADEIARALDGLDLVIVRNPDHADGLSTSLKAGFAALPPGTQAAIVLLGDMPRVPLSLIDALAAEWREADRPAALVPTYAGRRGNPVLLSRALAPEIMRLEGDTGAGPLLKGRTDVGEWLVDDAAVAHDIDTQEALAEAERERR